MPATVETVGEMTVAEFRALVEDIVRDQLAELLGDPDEGLELRPEFLRLLEERRNRFANGAETLSLDDAFAAAGDD